MFQQEKTTVYEVFEIDHAHEFEDDGEEVAGKEQGEGEFQVPDDNCDVDCYENGLH